MADETESKQKFVIKEDDIKVFKNIEGFDNLSKLLSNIFWGESQGDQHTAILRKPG